MVIASAAMLNTVRYTGYGCLMLSVHCASTPTTAMTTACRGPRSSNAIRSAAYDTESVAPLVSGIGRLTFQIDVKHAVTASVANRAGRGYARGNHAARTPAPRTITVAT